MKGPHEDIPIQKIVFPMLRRENELAHFYTIKYKFVVAVKMFIIGGTPDILTIKAKEFLR